jgi:diaminopimelate decarboxylase
MTNATQHGGQRWSDLSTGQWEALAKEYGTPFYLYDADAVRRKVQEVRNALQGHAQVYYAVKANPNLALLRALVAHADGVDISSGGELVQAQLAGFDPTSMSFAGPAKTTNELESAIVAGVGCISMESIREIDMCADIARRTGVRARVTLRVNPLHLNRAFGMKMGGKAVQFGIDEEDLPGAETRIMTNSEWLDFQGIHVYVGSQCFDPQGIVEATGNALRIARELEQRAGLLCAKVNLGGGFGVSHGEESRELNLAALTPLLVPLLKMHRENSAAPCDLIFELGRFLTAQAGIYSTRVVSSKTSRGKLFLACDGGLNHHLAAAGTFGAAMRGNFALCNLSNPSATLTTCSLAGPSCNPTDLLGVDVVLPEPVEGDLIGVAMSGSYGLTASPILFLGRDTPAEVVRVDGEMLLGRARHSMVDFN